MAGIRFTSSYISHSNEPYTIQIWDTAGSGSYEFTTDDKGFEIRYSGEGGELNPPILGTECTLYMYMQDETHFAIISDIVGASEDRFMLKIFNGGVLIWAGGVLPDIGSYEEASFPSIITLKASDGLASLKTKPFFDGTIEEPYTGKERAIQHICKALRKIRYVDVFYDNDDFFIRSAVDWWESTMDNNAEGPDALYHMYLDHAVWYDWEKGQRDYVSCYEVLRSIMTVLGATITSYQGGFFIQQRTYRTAETVVLRRYNKLGGLESTVNFAGNTTVDQTLDAALLAVGEYEFYPALASHTHTFLSKRRTNFLRGIEPYNFDNEAAQVIPFAIESNGGKTSLRFSARLRISISSLTFNPAGTNPLKPFAVVFRMYLGLDTVGMCRDMSLLPSYQVQYSNPYWASPPVYPIAFPITGSQITANISSQTYTITQTIDVFSARVPESVDEFTFAFELFEIRKFDGTGTYNISDFAITYDLVDPWVEAYSEGGPSIEEDEIVFYAKNDIIKNTVTTETNSLIGTTTDPNTTGAIWVKPGGTFALAEEWGDGTDPATREVEDLLCELIISGQATPVRKLNGTIFGDILAMFRLSWVGVNWLLVGGTWSSHLSEFSGEWAELKYAAGLSTSPPKRKNNPFFTGAIPPQIFPNNNGSGEKYGLNERPPGTLFYPVSMTTTAERYEAGAISSFSVSGILAKTNVYTDDIVAIVNPITGAWDELLVTADSDDGDTAIAVTGTLSVDYPINSPLIKKPIIGRFDLVAALNKFPEYISDEAAVADGKAVGDWYVAADGHLSVSAGVLKKIRAI